jgi:hypothetical protein
MVYVCVCSSSGLTGREDAETIAKTCEVSASERLGEDVSCIVDRAHTSHFKLVVVNQLAYRVVTDAEVAYPGVPSLILGKLTRGVVVAVDNSGIGGWVFKAGE